LETRNILIGCFLAVVVLSPSICAAESAQPAKETKEQRGDLGRHFPNTDKKFNGISSLKLLSLIKRKIKKAEILHIDSMIVAEEPKMAKYIEKMRKNIADSLSISRENVSIKATTTEGMGFTGKKEGVEAYAVVLVKRGDR
ncbi:MAG: 2-C-methyl-D-erythritol 2,4-cyclodiphosphate synthase, partial [candidate division Zixibacteria bacterium]|nr:2-C-methyl-D-erythritol 2,4-cyclodiphosphate synthase [candidate division Zixibacteria bacterium]